MPDYRYVTGEASSYRRAYAVRLANPLDTGVPGVDADKSIVFLEEDVIVLGDKTVTSPSGSVGAGFTPAETFPLLDPQTGLPIGSMASHLDVYVLLNSLYIDLATRRDAATAAAAAAAASSPPPAPSPPPEEAP